MLWTTLENLRFRLLSLSWFSYADIILLPQSPNPNKAMASWNLARLGSCLCLLLAVSPARAQPAALDCNAVKQPTTPVELSYRLAGGGRVISQSTRGLSNDYIIWTRREVAGFIIVEKFSYVGGLPSDSQETSTLPGNFKARVKKYTLEGFPSNFDRRSDLRYKVTTTTTYADGTASSDTSMISYRFKSEDKMTIGSCALIVVHGETDGLDVKTGKTFHAWHLYFPELKLNAADGGEREPIVDAITTDLTPIAPIP